jgi:phosphate starvation-inducible PhoH-like protein
MAKTKRQYDQPSESQRLKTSRYTHGQKELVKSIRWNDITIGVGVAGTGKTSATLETAIRLLNDENSPIERIVYIRANVGLKGEKELGALPGDLREKVDHLSYPVRDNLAEFMGEGEINALFDLGKIEVTPISNLRGRSLSRAVIVLDEAQNCSYHTLKTVITRLGYESKLILIGDPDQCDIDLNNSKWNGFIDKTQSTLTRLKNSIEERQTRLDPLSSAALSLSQLIINSHLLPLLADRSKRLPFSQLAINLQHAKSKNDELAIGIIFFTQHEIVRHPILGQIIDYL